MDTSASFLDSLKDASNEEAWSQLVDLYSPLVRNYLARRGAASSDVEDVVQEVMAVVVRRFPDFQRQSQTGSFRSWLRTITVNCLRDQWKRKKRQPTAVGGTDFAGVIDQLADPDSGLSKVWDREHDEHVARYLLERIRPEFTEKTWQAFQRFAVDGLSADQVAAELSMTANAVFIAKSRVMASLRKNGTGLLSS